VLLERLGPTTDGRSLRDRVADRLRRSEVVVQLLAHAEHERAAVRRADVVTVGATVRRNRQLMNRHAEFGAEILLDHHDADPLAVASAFGHHRGRDGSGYPRTQHEHQVSLVTSIVKICDIYEALTAARPYKQPTSPIRAYRVMLAMGDRLDRTLLRRFIECNGVYPVGQLVELLDGRMAVVRTPTSDLLRPVVAIVDNVDNLELECDDDELVDLSDIQCCSAHGILCDLTTEEARSRQTAVATSS